MPRPHIPAAQRQFIIDRARSRCEYCQCLVDYATEPFAIEHIVPFSRGGSTSLDNLAFSCSGCNGHKYNKTEALDPISSEVVSLFNPRQQRWQEHFGWNEDYTLVIGLTPTGRATVEALQLNRPGVVNLRSLLILIRKHPPKFGE